MANIRFNYDDTAPLPCAIWISVEDGSEDILGAGVTWTAAFVEANAQLVRWGQPKINLREYHGNLTMEKDSLDEALCNLHEEMDTVDGQLAIIEEAIDDGTTECHSDDPNRCRCDLLPDRDMDGSWFDGSCRWCDPTGCAS